MRINTDTKRHNNRGDFCVQSKINQSDFLIKKHSTVSEQIEDPSNRDSTEVKIIKAFTRFTLVVSLSIIPSENNKKSDVIEFHSSFPLQSLALSLGFTRILSCDGMLRTRQQQYTF